MKKLIIIISIILTSIFLSSCDNKTEQKIQKYYSTGSVFSGSINLKESYIWYIKWEKTVNLSSKIWWKITNIYVKEWDYVQKWILLATFDSPEAKVWYLASNNIINTLNSTKKSTSDLFDKQISQIKTKIKQINSSKIWSEEAIIDTNNITQSKLKTLQSNIDIAKTTLKHTKTILNTKEENIYKNAKNSIVWAIILDTNIIDFSDFLLWVTEKNQNKNNTFEIYLSAKNTNYLTEAKNLFVKVNKKYLSYKDFYNKEIDWKKPSKEAILKWLNDWESLAEDLKSLLSIIYNTLDSSIENVNFTSDTINNYKTKISIFFFFLETNLLSISWPYILWLKWSSQNLKDFQEEKNMQLDLLERQLSLAENNYSGLLATNSSQISNVKTKWEIAIEQLNEVQISLSALMKQKEVALNEIQAKIDEINGKKDLEWVIINNGKIFSPINWIVTKKIAEVWQIIWAWIPILEVSNNEKLKINIYLSEESLKNKNLFDDVLLEIEWAKKQILWKITNIVKSKNLVTKKIKIEISLKNNWDNIKIWSSVKVIFNNLSENNSIIIPNNAIISKFMIPWVYVLNKNIVKFKNLKIIKQNDDFSQVIWVKIWDTIIIDWKENILDWEILNK